MRALCFRIGAAMKDSEASSIETGSVSPILKSSMSRISCYNLTDGLWEVEIVDKVVLNRSYGLFISYISKVASHKIFLLLALN